MAISRHTPKIVDILPIKGEALNSFIKNKGAKINRQAEITTNVIRAQFFPLEMFIPNHISKKRIKTLRPRPKYVLKSESSPLE
jgi:hypothetical protein